ncbi:MAG TPA: DMT family transporter [Bacillota bacterium]|nr:DMT family transporter [Bacillota bacterium]
MLISLIILGIVGGMFIPLQTSVNAALSSYTRSTIYTSTISFGVGSLFLVGLNLLFNPETFSISFFSEQTYNSYWVTGGMLGVTYLIGNLLLLPRLGASLTVITTLSGQMVMGVIIDAFGWLGAPVQPFTLFKAIGIALLIAGIILMNITRRNGQRQGSIAFYGWLIAGFIVGWGPPIQTAINSLLSKQIASTLMASFVSYTVGFIVLLIIKLITNRTFTLEQQTNQYGPLKPTYFIGGALGVTFIVANIYLMPHLGAALTIVAGMIGQMMMALIIDQFGILGIRKSKITSQKIFGMIIIIIGVIVLRFL